MMPVPGLIQLVPRLMVLSSEIISDSSEGVPPVVKGRVAKILFRQSSVSCTFQVITSSWVGN